MKIKSPRETYDFIKQNIKPEWVSAFITAICVGMITHLPIFMSDIPNHDGLASIYFDQNMITSGRWFLSVACGFSSYFTLPWLIGLISLIWLGLAAAALVEILEVRNRTGSALIAAVLVSFPSLASTYAYIFTADGYMMALFLAVFSVLLAKKYRYGFVPGGICLALSMGIYQAYLPFAMLLCLYVIGMLFLMRSSKNYKQKKFLSYLGMGVIGVALYYVMLHVLLIFQNKELADYQGINGMAEQKGNLLTTIFGMYKDFAAFTAKGNVLFNNVFSVLGLTVLGLATMYVFFRLICRRGVWRNPMFYVTLVFIVLAVPLACNVLLLISPDLNYHVLIRYQWVLLVIMLIAFWYRYGQGEASAMMQWGVLLAAVIMIFNYCVTDNIGYSNLEKRYEKTYAYCLRLVDRMEQTEGYYTGMPVAMIGVVGDENYPKTDVTGKVTDVLTGMSGDVLCYTGENYKNFLQNYLGVTIEIVDIEKVGEIYNTWDVYKEMDSFPGENSMKVVDGMLLIKTENKIEE